MPPFKINIDGTEHDVERSAITPDEGFQIVGPDEVPDDMVRQSVMNETIKDRVSSAKTNALKNAHQQEQVRNQVLSELGIEVDEEGNPKGLKTEEVDLEREREKWASNNLDPLKEQLEDTQEQLHSIRENAVRQSIRGAFAGKAKDEYLDSEIGDPYVEQVFASKFKYNPEIGKVLQVDSDGNFERHPNGKKANGHGFVEPEDYIKLNADTKLMKRILKDDTQGGSGFNQGSGDNTDKKVITRTKFDNLNPSERMSFMQDGGQVVDQN